MPVKAMRNLRRIATPLCTSSEGGIKLSSSLVSTLGKTPPLEVEPLIFGVEMMIWLLVGHGLSYFMLATIEKLVVFVCVCHWSVWAVKVLRMLDSCPAVIL